MIDKAALQKFRTHMVKAAQEAGIDLKIGTIKFNEDYFSFSSKAYVIGGNGKQEEFNRYAHKKGVPASFYGQRLNEDGTIYTITGIKPRGRKNVLEITRDDGKTFICDVAFAKMHMVKNTKTITPTSLEKIV